MAIPRAAWQDLLLYLVVFTTPWALLYPALGFKFASDDWIMIVENRYMRDPGNWWRMISTDAFDRTIEGFDYDVTSLVGHWRPINKLSYLVDHTLWGPDSAFFHATGILIHLGSGLMLVYLCRSLGVPHLIAGLSGLLFLLHPIAARPLGLISLRADLWCGFFSLATVVCAVKGELDPSRQKLFRGLAYAGALLALAGKETALFLPLLFAGFYFGLGRRGPHPFRSALRQAWPYFAVVAFYAFLRFAVFSIATGTQNEFPDMSVWTLFMSLSRLAFSYLSELFAPMLVDHVWLPEILAGFPDWTVFLSWAALAGTVAVLWAVWYRDQPYLLLGLLIVVLPILPLLNIWAISGEHVGELLPFEAHRLYIPVMGLALAWGLIFTASWSWAGSTSRLGAQGVMLAMLVAYSALFPPELAAYRDTESIVHRNLRNIERFPDEFLPVSLRLLRLNAQAIDLKREQKFAEAKATFEKMLALRPYDAIALKNLAVIALVQKEPDRAIELVEAVLNPLPYQGTDGGVRMVIDDPQLRHTDAMQKVLGQAYRMKGDWDKAREHLLLSHEINPTDLDVMLLLAWDATRRENHREAEQYLQLFLSRASADDKRRGFAVRKLREAAANK